ncbi:DUF1433 domain-containing protein [Listeria welshimeri]|uniref:DUF1433 domain-containing protein n=1 Tax=Listeria welshimeri TaxID=1643 RepID=UPI001625F195|nr:DUF1433 domain-containing protein [Listeria welshimeri]MBC1469504.1 DUF1433 domain-containing protein [Listeria welshimeri]MBC1656163.1 DUF1433 domain-containing protein [Listeria welshimeri]MBC2375169.1 DUF1433 domain-containing protein [Listeria welshimeri]MBF2634770.1 DUF1433 domain-containing protein [Listeria welshimeri]
MKKKIIIIFSAIITIILFLAGGYFILKNQEEKDMKKILVEQKPRIETFFNYNYKGINNITLTSTKKNPTGVIHIKGYLNDDKDLWIDAALYDEAGIEVVNSAKEVDETFLKPEYEENIKTVSEIEKEETSHK